jgi:hypothetical protein
MLCKDAASKGNMDHRRGDADPLLMIADRRFQRVVQRMRYRNNRPQPRRTAGAWRPFRR